MTNEITLQEFLSNARQLRDALGDAEAALFEYLYRGETEWNHLWSTTGHTYEHFLDSHNICKVSRYREWLKAHGYKLVVHIPRVGMETVIAAASLKKPEQRQEMIRRGEMFAETNGVKMSGQTARKEARDIRMREAVVRSRGLGYSELVDKCKRLEVENQALKIENKSLKAENMALKRQCESRQHNDGKAA